MRKVNPRWLAGLPALLTLLLPACNWDGHFDVLGYTTRPNYDTSIHTVYVPIFKNMSYRRGLEDDLTRAVIREIESKTPFRVVACEAGADSILVGTVIIRNKVINNYNQFNEVRDVDVTLAAEINWRDLRPGHTGETLSQPRPGRPGDPPPDLPPGAPKPPGPPVLVQAIGNFIPEVGGSVTTAEQIAVNRLAVQIVSMMEKPW
jgi:hypothetical protein